jgi:hypothetical protein
LKTANFLVTLEESRLYRDFQEIKYPISIIIIITGGRKGQP